MRKQFFKYIIIPLVFLAVTIQFFHPDKNEGELNLAPFLADTNASVEVGTIIKNACADCHSNHTNYPWYSNIAPISFKMAAHVIEGKEELNFSEWQSYSLKRKEHKLKEIIEELKEKEMPLKSYLLMHPEARLSKEQIDLLINWATTKRKAYQQRLKNN